MTKQLCIITLLWDAHLLLIHQIVTMKKPGTRPSSFGFVAASACKLHSQYMAFLNIEMMTKNWRHVCIQKTLQQTFCVVSTIHGLNVKPQEQAELRPDIKSEKQHFSVMNMSWSSGPSSWVYTPRVAQYTSNQKMKLHKQITRLTTAFEKALDISRSFQE